MPILTLLRGRLLDAFYKSRSEIFKEADILVNNKGIFHMNLQENVSYSPTHALVSLT